MPSSATATSRKFRWRLQGQVRRAVLLPGGLHVHLPDGDPGVLAPQRGVQGRQLRGPGRVDRLEALAQGLDQERPRQAESPAAGRLQQDDLARLRGADRERRGAAARRSSSIRTASFSTRRTTPTCSGRSVSRRCASCRRCRPASAARSSGSRARRRSASRLTAAAPNGLSEFPSARGSVYSRAP